MSTVTYPSKTVPGFSEVVMECPDGWLSRSVPEAQIAIVQERSEVGRIRSSISGLPVVRSEGAWTGEATGTMAQALRMAVVEHDGVREVVEITGTCAGAQAKEIWPTLRAVQDSVELADR